MTQKQLFGLLTLVESVNITGFDIKSYIFSIINQCLVIEKLWGDEMKNQNIKYWPLDLTKEQIWSTYNDCLKFKFFIDKSRFLCEAKIYKGNFLDGEPEYLIFKALLQLPKKAIRKIQPQIQLKFHLKAIDSYNDFLESQKQEWLQNFKNEVLEKHK